MFQSLDVDFIIKLPSQLEVVLIFKSIQLNSTDIAQ